MSIWRPVGEVQALSGGMGVGEELAAVHAGSFTTRLDVELRRGLPQVQACERGCLQRRGERRLSVEPRGKAGVRQRSGRLRRQEGVCPWLWPAQKPGDWASPTETGALGVSVQHPGTEMEAEARLHSRKDGRVEE